MGAVVTWQLWPKENRRQRRWRKRYGQQATVFILLLLLILMATALSGCGCGPVPTPGTPTVPPTLPPTGTPLPPTKMPPTVPPTLPPIDTPTPVPPTQPPTLPPTQPPTLPPTQPPTLPPTQPPTPFPPTLPPNIEWLGGLDDHGGLWRITHYYTPKESDLHWANDIDITVNGFPDRTFKYGFINETLMQGTGQMTNGRFISIDYEKTLDLENGPYWFKEGHGNLRISAWKTVASNDSRLHAQANTEIVIEAYQERGAFLVVDAGGGLKPSQVDVYIGVTTYDDANSPKINYSRVGLVK